MSFSFQYSVNIRELDEIVDRSKQQPLLKTRC